MERDLHKQTSKLHATPIISVPIWRPFSGYRGLSMDTYILYKHWDNYYIRTRVTRIVTKLETLSINSTEMVLPAGTQSLESPYSSSIPWRATGGD